MTVELIEYGDATQHYQGYLSFPAGIDPAPCVFILHDWSGVSESTHEVADEIARLGYVAFAVDLYGKGRRGTTPKESADLMQPFLDQRDRIVASISPALEVACQLARIDAGRMAAVGFCFGGLCALDLARRGLPLKGVVSVHGVLAPIPRLPPHRIDTRILVVQGSEDPLASPTDVQSLALELSRAGADWQSHVFGGVLHAFTNPTANDPAAGVQYDALAHARTRRLTAHFLREVLSVDAG